MITKNHTDGRNRNSYTMTTSHTNIKMKKGDKIWIRAHGNWVQFAHEDWCNFSEVKL